MDQQTGVAATLVFEVLNSGNFGANRWTVLSPLLWPAFK